MLKNKISVKGDVHNNKEKIVRYMPTFSWIFVFVFEGGVLSRKEKTNICGIRTLTSSVKNKRGRNTEAVYQRRQCSRLMMQPPLLLFFVVQQTIQTIQMGTKAVQAVGKMKNRAFSFFASEYSEIYAMRTSRDFEYFAKYSETSCCIERI